MKVSQRENIALAQLEKKFMVHAVPNRYLACEDLDFRWKDKDVKEFDHMWKEGLSIWDIARAFDRDPDEVAILVIDRVRGGHIHPRKNGVFGRRRQL